MHGARGYCTVHFPGDVVVVRSAVVGVVCAKNESKFEGKFAFVKKLFLKKLKA